MWEGGGEEGCCKCRKGEGILGCNFVSCELHLRPLAELSAGREGVAWWGGWGVDANHLVTLLLLFRS